MPKSSMPFRVVILSAVVATAAFAQTPPVTFPPENPYTPEKAILGKILFWEEQMSSDNTQACGTCHIPTVGGGDARINTPQNLHPGPDGIFGNDDDIRGSRGVVRCSPGGAFLGEPPFFPNAQVTRRKSPSFIGAAWAPELFWDGRAHTTFVDPQTQQIAIQNFGALESQAVGPITSDVEMACHLRNQWQVCDKLGSVRPMRLASNLPPDMAGAIALYPTYQQLFTAAYGDPAITSARIAFAIATYERTLVPDQTPWDHYQAGNTAALTASQQAGLLLFNGIANCGQCHIPPLFTDHSFANIGVRPDIEDAGRWEVTGADADRGKFRVPSLRNVGLRAPFFHNGGKPDMQAIVLFYKLGGDFPGPHQDSRIVPLTLLHSQELQLADFVQNALIDPRVAAETYPFDRPTLNSENGSNFPAAYGYGTAGTGNVVPIILAPHSSYLGNPYFTVGIAQGVGGAPAALAVSQLPSAPGSTFGSNPLWVDPNSVVNIFYFPLAGTVGAAGAGYGSIVTNISYIPTLAGAGAFLQGAVADPTAPGGLAVTAGTAITLIDLGPGL
jgi:cytochrome c peroxidase